MSKRYVTPNADGGIAITEIVGVDPDGARLTKAAPAT